MRAFISAQLTGDAMRYIQQHAQVKLGGWGHEGRILTPEELVAQAGNPDFMVICYEPVTDYVLENMPNLKFISCTRGGIENISLDVIRRHPHVYICNAPGRNANAVSDLTMGLILDIARNISLSHRYIFNRDWEHAVWFMSGGGHEKSFMGYELEDKTLGLVGLGDIGRRVAMRARSFGMRVIACDPYARGEDGISMLSLEALLAESDFVSLHCKVTQETKGMINKQTLDLMKPTAYIINTARGALIRQTDLCEVLRARRIAGAALDVLDPEPVEKDSPLLQLDNVVITPHIGGASHDILPQQTKIAMQDITAFIEGRRPVHVVS